MTPEELEARMMTRRSDHYQRRAEAWPVYALCACLTVAIVATGSLASFITAGWLR